MKKRWGKEIYHPDQKKGGGRKENRNKDENIRLGGGRVNPAKKITIPLKGKEGKGLPRGGGGSGPPKGKSTTSPPKEVSQRSMERKKALVKIKKKEKGMKKRKRKREARRPSIHLICI